MANNSGQVTCSDCKFCSRDSWNNTYRCRLNPPVIVGNVNDYAVFPVVASTFWCGQGILNNGYPK